MSTTAGPLAARYCIVVDVLPVCTGEEGWSSSAGQRAAARRAGAVRGGKEAAAVLAWPMSAMRPMMNGYVDALLGAGGVVKLYSVLKPRAVLPTM